MLILQSVQLWTQTYIALAGLRGEFESLINKD